MKRSISQFLIAASDLSPKQVALLLSVGLVAGVFPIAGVATPLCLLAAWRLGLNPVALQLVNHMSAPLQWVLLLPLERAGAQLCGNGAIPGERVLSLVLHAVAGWVCVCVPLGVPLYFVLVFILQKRCLPRFNRSEKTA